MSPPRTYEPLLPYFQKHIPLYKKTWGDSLVELVAIDINRNNYAVEWNVIGPDSEELSIETINVYLNAKGGIPYKTARDGRAIRVVCLLQNKDLFDEEALKQKTKAPPGEYGWITTLLGRWILYEATENFSKRLGKQASSLEKALDYAKKQN